MPTKECQKYPVVIQTVFKHQLKDIFPSGQLITINFAQNSTYPLFFYFTTILKLFFSPKMKGKLQFFHFGAQLAFYLTVSIAFFKIELNDFLLLFFVQLQFWINQWIKKVLVSEKVKQIPILTLFSRQRDRKGLAH